MERKGRVEGKVAVITGGARGIGKHTALVFAEEGANVAIIDVSEDKGKALIEKLNKLYPGSSTSKRFVFKKCDISIESDVAETMKSIAETFGGRIDVLVNNAAVFVFGAIEKIQNEDWDKVLSVNIKGTAWCVKHSVEYMKRNNSGSIINLSSVSGYIAQPLFVPYSTTKAALLGLSRNLAYDLGPFNIRVNSCSPGTILTKPTLNAIQTKGAGLEEESRLHMMGRLGKPREVATAIVFLASDDASFVTGTDLAVDGGFLGMKVRPVGV